MTWAEVSHLPWEGACPVCGDPTGNCKGESDYLGSVVFEPPKRLDNPLATFTVPRRIYEERMIGDRKVKSLLYLVGARITPDEARRLGLLPS